jgi:tRNA G18 (ribose-2'-O)-methylase SpoU
LGKAADRRRILETYRKERARNALAEPGVHLFTVVLDHLKASFNVPKIFRSAEVFGAREIHLVGVPPFDPSPALGSFRKVPARFHESIEPALESLFADGFTLIALDPGASQSIHETDLPERAAFLFGHEEFGFSFDLNAHRDVLKLQIPQYGAVQSLNVSVAASIAMYEYVRQWSQRKGIAPVPPRPASNRHSSSPEKVFSAPRD